MRLLRGLAGHVLPCGCLVGVYETYDNDVVSTVDARGTECPRPDHALHALVDLVREGVRGGTIDSCSASPLSAP